MTKKLISACTALAAFAAVALPASASAANSPDLTEGGSRVAVGSTVVATATSAEIQNTSTSTLVTCSSAKMSGTLFANSSGSVEVSLSLSTFKGTGAASPANTFPECTGSFGNAAIIITSSPLCLTSTPAMGNDEFQIGGGTCAVNTQPKFAIVSTTAGECEYTTTNRLSGTYTTNGAQASLTVNNTQGGSGSAKIAGGFLCPTSLMLKMTFSLEGGLNLTLS